MTEQTIGEWIECVVDKDYEIYSAFPYPIKKKGSYRIINECQAPNGYMKCWLNEKAYLKHRIIAQQFIPNDDPEHKTQIDHINHNRTDNRIENLRWVSVSENNKNRSYHGQRQYVLINKLPDTAEPLDGYNNHEFDGLWIDYTNQKLYVSTGIQYRELLEHRCRGHRYYSVYDMEDKQVNLFHKTLFG